MSITLPLDHVVALCPDLAAAGAAFEAAGFRTTPLSHHSARMGTANICVMFKDSYIELMGIVSETEANAAWRAMLAEGGGLRGIALRSEEINDTADALDAAGVPHEPVRHFSRRTEDGELRFSVIRVDLQATPGVQCLFCQHHTPELLWQTDYMNHPNGTRRILGVQLPDLASLAPLAGLPGPGAVPFSPGAPAVVLSAPPVASSGIRRHAGLELICA